MLFLISLAAALLFTVLCGDVLKKHPIPFYVGFTAVALFFAFVPLRNAPDIISDYLIAVLSKGSLAAAFFALVMFAGAFKAGTKGAKKLMPIRAELAIVASLLTITHLISYGFLYIKRLITGSISPTQKTVTILAIPLVILLIPLAVTSFKKIRKKMDPKKWKKLQRFAYGFYLLLYVHILLAYMPSARHGKVKSIVNVIVYSALFLTYGAMRISKALAKKHKNSEKKIGVSLSAASAAVFAAVSVIALVPAVAAKTASNIPTSSQAESVSAVSTDNTVSTASITESQASRLSKSSDNVQSTSEQESKASSKAVSKVTASSKNTSSEVVSSTSSSKSSSHENDTVTEREETIVTESEQEEHTEISSAEFQQESISESSSSNGDENITQEEPEPEDNRIFNDGEYTAKCCEEDDDVRVMITVKLVIENDRIADIQVESDETDTWYLDNVMELVVPSITEREGNALDDLDDIDAVSGATLSSNGVKRAVKDALDQARITR